MKIGFAAHPDERKSVRRPARYLKRDKTGQYAEMGQYDGPLPAQSLNGTALPPASFAAFVTSRRLMMAPCREIQGRQIENRADQTGLDGTGESSGRHPTSTIVLQLPHSELGTVAVRVSTVNSGVAISFVTQTAAGRAAIAGQVDRLIRPITQQGIAISRCDVRTAGSHSVAADESTPPRHELRDYWA